MPYTLVQPEQTIDLGRDGSKWRHGWVPLNAAATAIKLKRERAGGPSGGKGLTAQTNRARLKAHGAVVRDALRTPIGERTPEQHRVAASTIGAKKANLEAPGKSRLSTSDVRPSRPKLKGAKGRSSGNPFQRAVARGDIKPTGREHLGGGTHGKAAAVQSSHPIGSPVMAQQPGIETETRGHVTGHTDAGMVKVQYKDRHGNQTVGTFNPSHTRVLTGQEAAQHDYEHGGATAKPGLDPSKTMTSRDHVLAAVDHNDKAVAAMKKGDLKTANDHAELARHHNQQAMRKASADDLAKLREKPGGKNLVDEEIRSRLAAKPASAPVKATGETLTDGKGNKWTAVQGTNFVEDPDSGERFTRSYVEGKFGSLNAKPASTARTHEQQIALQREAASQEIKDRAAGMSAEDARTKYQETVGAGRLVREDARKAQQSAPAAYSLKVTGLEGYGVTDLKRIAKLSAGPHDASHAPAGTIAAAEAELRSRGYVKSPSGAWTKPRAPKVKNTTSGLRGTNVTKREQAATGLSARKRNLVSQKDLFGRSGR